MSAKNLPIRDPTIILKLMNDMRVDTMIKISKDYNISFYYIRKMKIWFRNMTTEEQIRIFLQDPSNKAKSLESDNQHYSIYRKYYLKYTRSKRHDAKIESAISFLKNNNIHVVDKNLDLDNSIIPITAS